MRIEEAERLIRAVTHPYPGAFIDLNGRRLRVWAAELADPASPDDDSIVLKFADGGLKVTEMEWMPSE